ncbi:hypothetical protein C8J56DRAFT_1040103 [Mycena floridula]|nr:hypothetical protein C8J56DRAFT_1040103 [Mycena floridula]
MASFPLPSLKEQGLGEFYATEQTEIHDIAQTSSGRCPRDSSYRQATQARRKSFSALVQSSPRNSNEETKTLKDKGKNPRSCASQDDVDSQTQIPTSQVYNPDDFNHGMDPPTFDEHRTTFNKVKLLLEFESDSEELLRFRAGLPSASQPVELAEPVFTVTKLEELEYKIEVVVDGHYSSRDD